MPQFKRIYIIGFMGSGKSTAGKKLAAGLGWTFIDLDRKIEDIVGKTITEIFSDSGEEFFRELESEALRSIDIQRDSVISVGGGTPCFSNNMDFMNNTGIVIYLKMTPQQLKSRLSGEPDVRPLLKGLEENNLHQYIEKKLLEREKYYNQALMIINGINLNIKKLIDQVNILLKG
jgi:shikimate kinase